MTIRISPPVRDHSPFGNDKIRIQATISDDNAQRDIWFDFPESMEGSLTELGNPWLLAALPYGLQTGQDIVLDMPVDAVFLENMLGWVRKFRIWSPQIQKVAIETPTTWSKERGEKTFSFFSGGVDSWFTLLRHVVETEGYPQVGTIDQTITAWGFDIPISNKSAFDEIAAQCREAVEHFNVSPIFVATNIRDDTQSWWKTQWGPITHGLGLAAVGQFLSPMAQRILIPSGDFYMTMPGQGSHPYTDHLFSSSRTSFIHDHPRYKRIEKIECISHHPHALKTMHVCNKQQSEVNCGVCEKCFRTLRILELLDVLDQATSFDLDHFRSQRHRFVYTDGELQTEFMRGLCDIASERGNHEMTALLKQNLTANKRIDQIVGVLSSLPGEPFAWRLKRYLTRNMIR